MKNFNKFFIAAIMFSLLGLYSCGKKEGTTTTSDSKTETGTTTGSKTESSSSDNISAGSDFTIKYELTGSVKGDLTTYKKGSDVKQEMSMDVKGMKMNSQSYYDDKFAYVIMDAMGKKMGTKLDISKYKEEGSKEGKDIDYVNMQNYLKDKKKVGTETVMGKECDIYETGKDVKISVYKGTIPLKISTPQMTMTAISMSDKVSLSSDEMKPPKDIEYMDISKMTGQFKK